MKNKYSIIIPVYNNQVFLPFCIESILNQKCYSNYEIILINDGSTDDSYMVCKEYQEKYDNIYLFNQENHGQLYSRIFGYNHANGDYVLFLDSDDMLSRNALSIIDDVLLIDDYDMVICKWIRFSGDNFEKEKKGIFEEGVIDKNDVINKIVSSHDLNTMGIKIINKGKIGIFDLKQIECLTEFKNGEDLIQTLLILDRCNDFYYIDKPIYCYRQNPKSITNTYNPKQYRSLEIRNMVKSYLVDNNIFQKYEKSFYYMYYNSIFSELTQLSISNIDNKGFILGEINEFIQKGDNFNHLCKSGIMIDKKILIYLFKVRQDRLALLMLKLRHIIVCKMGKVWKS